MRPRSVSSKFKEFVMVVSCWPEPTCTGEFISPSSTSPDILTRDGVGEQRRSPGLAIAHDGVTVLTHFFIHPTLFAESYVRFPIVWETIKRW